MCCEEKQSRNVKWIAWVLSCSVVSDSLQPHGLQPARLLHPWDFPAKNTGEGSFSRGSFKPSDRTHVFCVSYIEGDIHFYMSCPKLKLYKAKIGRLEGKWENHINISFKNASGRGNRGSDPERGICLAKGEIASRKVWLEQWDQGTGKSEMRGEKLRWGTTSWSVL